MSLRSKLSGTFDLADLHRLTSPVAWDGTKDADEAAAEEADLRAFAREASQELQEFYTHGGDGESDYAVRVEAGEVVEIVAA